MSPLARHWHSLAWINIVGALLSYQSSPVQYSAPSASRLIYFHSSYHVTYPIFSHIVLYTLFSSGLFLSPLQSSHPIYAPTFSTERYATTISLTQSLCYALTFNAVAIEAYERTACWDPSEQRAKRRTDLSTSSCDILWVLINDRLPAK